MGNYEIEHGKVKIKSVADLSIKDLEDLEKIEPIILSVLRATIAFLNIKKYIRNF